MPKLKRPLFRKPPRNTPEATSYFDASKRHQERIQSEILSQNGRSEHLAAQLADAAHLLSSRFLEEVGTHFQTDCKAGCASCCYQPATAFPFEAIRIAQRLQKTLSAPQLEALIRLLEARVRGLNSASVKKSINDKTPCPLLFNDQCSIYEDRPLTCRMAHSFSVKHCRTAFKGDRTKSQIPVSLELLTGVSGIIEGIFEQLPRKNLDADLYELCSVLLTALRTPDAALRWAKGDRSVFAGCIKDDT